MPGNCPWCRGAGSISEDHGPGAIEDLSCECCEGSGWICACHRPATVKVFADPLGSAIVQCGACLIAAREAGLIVMPLGGWRS